MVDPEHNYFSVRRHRFAKVREAVLGFWPCIFLTRVVLNNSGQRHRAESG